jgi:hypothetical protein
VVSDVQKRGRERRRRRKRGGLGTSPLQSDTFGCLLCGLKHPKMYNIDDL